MFATLAVRALARRAARRAARAEPPWWAAPATGFTSGALTTSTNTAGPPVVLYMLARGATPVQTRDTLTVTFIGFALLGAAALALSGTERSRTPPRSPRSPRPPWPATSLGRPVFARIADHHYEPVLTGRADRHGAGRAGDRCSSLELMHVEIWSDIACPWCYVGKRRFEAALAAFEHRDEVRVTWRSFELDPGAPRRARGRPRRAPRRASTARASSRRARCRTR